MPPHFMIKCQVCNEREKTQVKESLYCCDECIPPKMYFPGTIETVTIGKLRGVEKSRVDELKRRVIIGSNADGSYRVGRKSDNGKIEDREPSY